MKTKEGSPPTDYQYTANTLPAQHQNINSRSPSHRKYFIRSSPENNKSIVISDWHQQERQRYLQRRHHSLLSAGNDHNHDRAGMHSCHNTVGAHCFAPFASDKNNYYNLKAQTQFNYESIRAILTTLCLEAL